MKQLSLLCVFLFPYLSHAQFAPSKFITEPSAFYATASADFDEDGDMDLVASLSKVNRIVWFENTDGNGLFSAPKIIASGIKVAFDLAVADINGDGFEDVIYFSNTDKQIFWSNNRAGTGEFDPPSLIGDQVHALKFITPTDIDGDGDIDIVYSLSFGSGIFWYKNEDGNGTQWEGPLTVSSSFSSPKRTHAHDMDGDGDTDLVSSSIRTDRIVWFENETGIGDFTAEKVVASSLNNPYPIHIEDVNGDNFPDIVAASNNTRILWFKNEDGQGNFSSTKTLGTTTANDEYLLNVADMDTDGDPDIVVSSTSEKEMFWFPKENGVDSFGAAIPLLSTPADILNTHLIDLNGDNALDILSIFSSLNSTMNWFPNTNGNFGPRNTIVGLAASVSNAHHIDIDGDGGLDIVAALGSAKIAWFPNINGEGIFDLAADISDSKGQVYNFDASDIDGDDDQDLLVAYDEVDLCEAFENMDGQGNFSIPDTLSSSGFYGIVKSGDLDGDNQMDVVLAAHHRTAPLAIFRNTDGTGQYDQASYSPALDGEVLAIHLADLDSDTDLDIILVQGTSFTTPQLVWLENTNGLGTFSAPQAISISMGEPYFLEVGDLDNDDDIDFMVGSLFSSERVVQWYRNTDGTGQFELAETIKDDFITEYKMTSADFDQDGDLDLIFSIYNDFIYWKENQEGRFGIDQVVDSTAGYPRYLKVADLNKDGFPDPYIVNSTGAIKWYENLFDQLLLRSHCFLDSNENGLRDSAEILLLDQAVELNPASSSTWRNGQGDILFTLAPGPYRLNYVANDNWKTTTADTLDFTISAGVEMLKEFGLAPKMAFAQITPFLSSAPTRCDTKVPFWLNYTNQGTINATGYIRLDIDSTTTYEIASPLPDSIQGNSLFWNINDLPPTYDNRIKVELTMPNFQALGSTINFQAQAYVEENGIFTPSDSTLLSSIIRCAYDPNDKLVAPDLPGDDNFILLDDTLTYTVRFQNTGNDTAFLVRIEDQLDANLNWASLEILAASHSYSYALSDAGLLTFTFENIHLPDSNINESGSHGFIKYRIQQAENLPIGTIIKNTANIFFDSNPAIVTNTVVNTLTDQIVSIQEAPAKEGMIQHFQLYPNPASQGVQLDIQLAQAGQLSIAVWDSWGKRAQQTQQGYGQKLQFQLADLTAGIYFVQLKAGDDVQTKKLVILGR